MFQFSSEKVQSFLFIYLILFCLVLFSEISSVYNISSVYISSVDFFQGGIFYYRIEWESPSQFEFLHLFQLLNPRQSSLFCRIY